MDIYNNKWVQQIISLQHDDGSWGYFHTLSKPTTIVPMTTEQALRRLFILGLTKDDEPIKRALNYMRNVLTGSQNLPDRREKVLNWDAFEKHMIATWIRIFDKEDVLTISIVNMWVDIVVHAFKNGHFDESLYSKEYRKYIPILNKRERVINVSQFYMINLLQGVLDKETENHFVDYLINHDNGITYIYHSKIAEIPQIFQSIQTNRWLAALELIAGYDCAKNKLQYAIDWIYEHQDKNKQWDLGQKSKDGTYFPLSNSWHKSFIRKQDCTIRIEKLLEKVEGRKLTF